MAAAGPSLQLPACSPDILTASVGGSLTCFTSYLVSGLSLYLFTYFYFIIIIVFIEFVTLLLLFSCFGVFLWPPGIWDRSSLV